MDINIILKTTGEYVSTATAKTIQFISSMGADITVTQAKIINLVIILILLYVIMKLIVFSKPLIKFAIIALLIFLAVSIGYSFVN